jgi:hypothetical protein
MAKHRVLSVAVATKLVFGDRVIVKVLGMVRTVTLVLALPAT